MPFADAVRAIYNFTATADDMLSLRQGQVLYSLPPVDPEDAASGWTTVRERIPADETDPDAVGATGLVPASYIEPLPAKSKHVMKWAYVARDGEDEELTVSQAGAIVELLDDGDPDWCLVRFDAQAGLVPRSYVDLDNKADGPSSDSSSASISAPTAAVNKVPEAVNQATIQTTVTSPASPARTTGSGVGGGGSAGSIRQPAHQRRLSTASTVSNSSFASIPPKSASYPIAKVLATFEAQDSDELSVIAGQYVVLMDNASSEEWWQCRLAPSDEDPDGIDAESQPQGLVPANWLKIVSQPPKQLGLTPPSAATKPGRSQVIPANAANAASNRRASGGSSAAPALPKRSNANLDELKQSFDKVTMGGDLKTKLTAASTTESSSSAAPQTPARRAQQHQQNTPNSPADDNVPLQQLMAQKKQSQQQNQQQKKKQLPAVSVIRKPGSNQQVSSSGRTNRPGASSSSASAAAANPSNNNSNSKNLPEMSQVRNWTDATGTFRIDAQFICVHDDGRIELLKTNGNFIKVPIEKLSRSDLVYLEHATGQPLLNLIEPEVPKYNENFEWFDFFTLKCGINADQALKYARAFTAERLDDSNLLDLTRDTIKSLGVTEGDVLRIFKGIELTTGRKVLPSSIGSNNTQGSTSQQANAATTTTTTTSSQTQLQSQAPVATTATTGSPGAVSDPADPFAGLDAFFSSGPVLTPTQAATTSSVSPATPVLSTNGLQRSGSRRPAPARPAPSSVDAENIAAVQRMLLHQQQQKKQQHIQKDPWMNASNSPAANMKPILNQGKPGQQQQQQQQQLQPQLQRRSLGGIGASASVGNLASTATPPPSMPSNLSVNPMGNMHRQASSATQLPLQQSLHHHHQQQQQQQQQQHSSLSSQLQRPLVPAASSLPPPLIPTPAAGTSSAGNTPTVAKFIPTHQSMRPTTSHQSANQSPAFNTFNQQQQTAHQQQPQRIIPASAAMMMSGNQTIAQQLELKRQQEELARQQMMSRMTGNTPTNQQQQHQQHSNVFQATPQGVFATQAPAQPNVGFNGNLMLTGPAAASAASLHQQSKYDVFRAVNPSAPSNIFAPQQPVQHPQPQPQPQQQPFGGAFPVQQQQTPQPFMMPQQQQPQQPQQQSAFPSATTPLFNADFGGAPGASMWPPQQPAQQQQQAFRPW